MPKQQEITARFVHERAAFQNADSRVIIGIAHSDKDFGELTIKGEAAEKQLIPGMWYRFWGYYTNHHKHGRQFVFTSFVVDTPADRLGVVTYLEQCDGIGPSTAHGLWEAYGPDAVRMLREEPVVARKAVPRLTVEKAKAASEYLKRWQKMERVRMEVISLLDGRGFRNQKKLREDVIGQWGNEAAEMIREDPYRLMIFPGCGFRLTDKMFLGMAATDQDRQKRAKRLRRQALCAADAVNRDSEGHTWHPFSMVKYAIRDNVTGAIANPDRALKIAIRQEMLVERIVGKERWIADARKARHEELIARYVDAARLEVESGMHPLIWPAVDGLDLDPHQIEELKKSIAGPIGILAGSPGTGKTHTTAALIRAIIAEHGMSSVAVCAPAGKAAVRLTIAMARNEIALTATTIHRLLSIANSDGGYWEFEYCRQNPLPHEFIICDESSMNAADLMASLLAARGAGSMMLFVGDPNQLASVGHGRPFMDMISAGIPYGELRKIHRNGGRIVQACAEIRDKRRFSVSPGLNVEVGENLILLENREPNQQIDALVRYFDDVRSAGKYDPIWDVQVLCAVNKKSPLGRKPLNDKLQGLLNPTGAQCAGSPFRVGDKIINGKNGWLPSFEKSSEANDKGQVFVANGELAEVLIVEPARTIAKLESPPRTIIIPRGKANDNDDRDADDREDAEAETGTGCSWELGYAISVHKSQGSEWPIVLVMIDDAGGAQKVCTRNWLYTAISRAKEICVMIGRKSTAEQMCHRDGLNRKTFLVEQIRELNPLPEPEVIEPDWSSIFEGVAV